jgi:hypothetical protein
MVTTNSDPRTDTASVARGGNGNQGRGGLKAKLAVGLAVLGCAAGLTLGGLRVGDTAPPRAVSAPPAIQAPAVDQREQQRFLEQNRWLPDGALPATAVPLARQRFLEVNTVLPPGPAPATALPREGQRFLELNTVLPTGPQSATAPADQRSGPLP